MAIGPFIVDLSLTVGTWYLDLPTSQNARPLTGFSSRCLYGLTDLNSFKLKLGLADDVDKRPRSNEMVYRDVRDLLGALVAAAHLRHLEVHVSASCQADVLCALLGMSRLETLALHSIPSKCSEDELTTEAASALDRAVVLCRFPELKHLTLGGQFMWPTASSPLGLLTLWSRSPRAFMQLETVYIHHTRSMYTEVVGRSMDDFNTQLLQMPEHRPLQSLRLRGRMYNFLLGPCTGASHLRVLEFDDRFVFPETTVPLLDAVAPAGGGGCLEELVGLPVVSHDVLTGVMLQGRLSNLRHLGVDMTWVDRSDPNNEGVQLFQFWAQNADVCPLLGSLTLLGDKGCAYVFEALWDVVAARQQAIHSVKLDYTQEVTQLYNLGVIAV